MSWSWHDLRRGVLWVGSALYLAACANAVVEDSSTRSRQEQQIRDEVGGSVFGSGGLSFGTSRRSNQAVDSSGGGIGVNSFLWRASLDILAFMPITAADPAGGTILSDWYSPADAPDERFKVNVFILDRQLRSDGVRASVFRQARDGGQWRDVQVGRDTGTQLENAILTRARELRVSQNARG